MRVIKVVALFLGTVLLLQACGGPLVSEYKSIRDVQSIDKGSWTENGNYCLPKTVLSVDVIPTGAATEQASGTNATDVDVQGTLIILTPQIIPDLSETYSLNYNESIFANDDVTVSYLKNQFGSCILSKITSSNEDKSGEIAEKLASLALRVATGVPTAGPTIAAKGPTTKRPVQRVQMVLDGGNDRFRHAEAQLNSVLRAAGYDFSVSINPIGKWPATPPGEPRVGTPLDGIVFRTPQPFMFTVERNGLTLAQAIFYSETGSPLEFLPIRRSAFVKRVTTIDFTNGFPDSIETKKPSQMSAFMNVPLDIVNAVLSAPGQLLTVRVQNAQNQSQLLQSQAAVLDNQKQLMQKTQEMQDFMKTFKLRPSS